MYFIVIALLLLGLIIGPQFWAKQTFKKYSQHREDFPGNGAELVRHFINTCQLKSVTLEETESGDHYDPESKTVRLSKANYHGKSLTAIAVAAHEIGHALQDAENNRMLTMRTRLVKSTQVAEQISSLAFVGIPVIIALTRAPAAGELLFIIAISSMLLSSLVHLITLPVELDASFGKAMPLLKNGQYLADSDLLAAHKVLKAAAFTYLAGSLASLLNLARWIALFKRR